MSQPPDDWNRLADYVIAARLAAGFADTRAFAAAVGISERTIGKLENGRKVGPDTLAAVAMHIGWTPDSPRAVLSGGEPRMAAAAPPAAPLRLAEAPQPGLDSALPEEVLVDFGDFKSYVPGVLLDQRLGRLKGVEIDVMANSAMTQKDRSWLVAWFRWGDDGRPRAGSGTATQLAGP